MGVAFNATIVNMRADDPGSCATEDGCAFDDGAIAAGINAAHAAGARVINLSLGGSSPGFQLLSAMQSAVNAGIVLVISAGNDGTANPDPFALTPAQQFPGMVIIAGSVGVNPGQPGDPVNVNQISTFSNRAGTGAQSYLAARGVDDLAPDETGTMFWWSGTSFSAPTISGAVALLAQAFPRLSGAEIAQILFTSADDLGASGVDSIYGRGRLNIARAMQPIGTTSLASGETAVSTTDNGDLPAAAGDATHGASLGAIILDGYSRAYALNLAATLRKADQDHPLSRALQTGFKSGSRSAGPLSIAMTVRERRDLPQGFALERFGVGPEDARRSRLIAGSAVARLDAKTAVAFGFAEGAKAMERRLGAVDSGAFLIARDVAGDPGFSATRDGSVAIRHQFGKTGVTLSGETGNVWQEFRTSATGSPYRWTSVAVDRAFGRNWLSAGIGRLGEKQSLLGGRMGAALGGGGSTSLFLDVEVRHRFGDGWSAGLTARRGWTDFAAGKFQTGAYGLDLAKAGVIGASDELALRVAQPLRIERGGFAAWLPTSYDYATETATSSLGFLPLTPHGRELDGELSYGSRLLDGRAWFGGNLFYRRQPGHLAAADDDVGAAIRFSLGF
jgi:hypothetical protein